MAFRIADRIREISTTTGTGNFVLAGTLTGYRRVQDELTTLDTFPYCIASRIGDYYEVGVGVLGNDLTLERTAANVTDGSSGPGVLVDFPAGNKDVICSYIAALAMFKDTTATLTAGAVIFVGTDGRLSQDPTKFFYAAATDRLGVGTNAPSTTIHAVVTDSATLTPITALTLSHASTGTPGVGFGVDLLFALESSTTEERTAATLSASWAIATDATRAANLVVQVYTTTTPQTAIWVQANAAAGVKIGFFGVTPAAQPGATDDIKDALTTLGLLQGTSATPLNLDGGALSAGTGTFTGKIQMAAATTLIPSYNVTEGVAPTTPAGGDVWNDSTQKALIAFLAGIKQHLIGCLFTQTADVTVANTATETSLVGTGIGTATLPANFFTVGKTIRVRDYGYYSTKTPTAGTLLFRTFAGSTVMVSPGALTVTDGVTNMLWVRETIITCRTTGSSGTVMAQGYIHIWSTNVTMAGWRAVGTSTITLDTTASQAIAPKAKWGTADAGNTITCTNMTIEALN